MRPARFIAAALIVALVIGCSLPRRFFAVSAEDFDVSPLVGQWTGQYANPETGRSGTIDFTLRRGETTAFGEVMMVPNSAAANSTTAKSGRTPLKISFIRKEGGGIVGTLDQYTDPECNCRVITTFQGKFSDSGTIEGTFNTEGVQGGRAPTGGNWRVTRVKKL